MEDLVLHTRIHQIHKQSKELKPFFDQLNAALEKNGILLKMVMVLIGCSVVTNLILIFQMVFR